MLSDQAQSGMRCPKPAGPASGHREDTVEAYQRSVERAIRHMQANLGEAVDLDRLAQIAAISKFHFVRVFDEVTGTTPRHFLACLRVQKAKELLLQSKLPITQICFEVGYNSLGSFSKHFSDLVGVSPQAFRGFPKRLNPVQFARAVWHFLATDQKVHDTAIAGTVELPCPRAGFIFVGAFTKGVPQGAPFSGTVMMKAGRFRIQRPDLEEFHLLAAFIPLSADLTAIVTTLPVKWVANLRVQGDAGGGGETPRLRLRPLRLTDPPILLALPALPPWRGLFTK